MNRGYSRTAFLFFFIVACVGTVLRSPFIQAIPLRITHLIHAHSHTAFQGWLYLILFILSVKLFLTKDQINSRKYKLQFILTSIVVLGILLTFSLQGYGLYSIIFSTLFQCLNYWFFRSIILDTRDEFRNFKPISLRFIRAGIFFGILSTLAPMAIGFLSAKGYKGTEIYESSIYYFLHFQYNGWFLFTTLGIFFKTLKKQHVKIDQKRARLFFSMLFLSVFPGLTLSYLGMSFRNIIFPFSVLAIILELCALVIIFPMLQVEFVRWLKKINVFARIFMLVSCLLFIVKTVIQLIALHPKFIELAFQNRLSIVFFLHLVLIGVLSFQIISQLYIRNWISQNYISQLGAILILLGFLTTEIILALGGIGIYYEQKIMFYGSLSMALGILFIGVNIKPPKRS